jgi:2-keto-4-pentenoate hydratase/2-oxohepta-3-ene-1,7-dioic acid hydratase in catechol pathway
MKLVTFADRNQHRLGALVGDGVLDLAAAASGSAPAFASMVALIEAGPDAWDAARALVAEADRKAMRSQTEVSLLAPLPRPTRLRDCSLMLEHMDVVLMQMARRAAAEENDSDAAYERLMASGKYSLNPTFKKQCVYYNADHTSVSGTGVDIVWPSYSDYIDFELEWACVIGRPAHDVGRERAADHIFGYTILNDWSARDVQMPLMYTMNGPGEGKDFPGSWGLGPCIVTPDEIGDPYDLVMTATINGEQWTRGNTGSMYHRFEDAIAQFSREKTILPGEVLGSGTVLGGCGFELGRSLSPGDVVELEVQNIGILRNRVVRADQFAA